MEKTISSLKHEDTNKQCQIKNLLERLTTAKTELVMAESYRDKFLSQGEKYEKLFRMSSTTELVNKHGAGLGYNKVEPPSAYTSIVDVRCKPPVDLVYNEELDIHKVVQIDNLSDPSTSTCSDEDDIPMKPVKEKQALKIKKQNKKTKKHSTVFVKANIIGNSSSDEYVTCPSDKSKRGRSMERKINFSGKQTDKQANKFVGTSKSVLSMDQGSAFIKKDQTICLIYGEENHFAADCFYNPRSRISSKLLGRGRKNSWSKSSTSSEEQGRSPFKKASEANDSRKKQNQKASRKRVSKAKKREASDEKETSEVHEMKTSNKPKKSCYFGRRPSEGKGQQESKGNLWIVDSGCSRHMTGNKTHLHKYEPFFGGSVAFGSDPVGGYITESLDISKEHQVWDYGILEMKISSSWLTLTVIMGQCKKQSCVSTSTAEAEYIAASSCCAQVIWIQNQMKDYGVDLFNSPIQIDNSSAISITNNPVKHSKTKYIDIRYHFIRNCAEKKLIHLVKVDSEHNLADLFTKAFDGGRFRSSASDFIQFILRKQISSENFLV
ncbi:hypothetical protein E3N88_25188 [Mikania micrantha]|uniref:Retrovirus-related Pol polyprotein from transposon TNT 1-94-like beta-barrel domain-containing protein n=1 Tax=Mikania micrantha TaxID=192012 RepID=A0A5N6N5R7_9ASTR|nr:hypothetical protein E3N88_25188 [Mikania micrantha]